MQFRYWSANNCGYKCISQVPSICAKAYYQRIVTGIEKKSRKNLVNIFHLLFGAIRLLEYILLIMEQIARVLRWFVLKKIYCQNVFVP